MRQSAPRGESPSLARIAAQLRPVYRPGIVLVGFQPSVSSARQHQLIRLIGARWQRSLGFTGDATSAARRLTRRIGTSLVLGVAKGQVLAAVKRLRQYRRWIRFAEPDYVMTASGVTTPNDPSFPLQWGSLNTGQTINGISGTQGADDGAAKAWGVSTGSPSIVIGEVDTGIDYLHPDLAANIWSNPGGIGGCPAGTHGYNIVSSTCDPMDDDTAYGGHGTHVAGIMGATGNNGTGVAGMNWSTTILPVKWLDYRAWGSTSELISALNWMVKAKLAGVNIRVVNDSATFVGTAYSQALSDQIDSLGANGILFVTAAGNTGANNDNLQYRRYPCGYDRPTEICVTASDQNDKLPSWANYGASTVDLAAPGKSIYSTLRNGTYGYIDGGSMAAAQVSGAAALILSVQDLSPTALKADILNNVHPLASLSGLVRTGGRLDVCAAMPGCATPAAPVVISAPAVSGQAQSGQTLTASTGSWSGTPTSYAYQWSRCDATGAACSAISGSTSSTYVVQAEDVSSTLLVAVTASNAGGASAPATSAPTAVVTQGTPAAPVVISAPAVSGQAQSGQTLTASTGSWSGTPTSYAYQWSRCDATGAACSAISGSTSSTYVVQAGDVSSTLLVAVTASNAGGASAPATSAPTAVVTQGTLQLGTTTVGGSVDTFSANRKRVNAYSLTQSGAASKLSIYLSSKASSGQANIEGVVYADSAGTPGALLGTTSQLTFSGGQAAGWYDLTLPTALNMAAGKYWIGVITGGTSGVAAFRYTSVSGSRDYNSNTYTAGPSNPFGAVSRDSEQMSLYATLH